MKVDVEAIRARAAAATAGPWRVETDAKGNLAVVVSVDDWTVRVAALPADAAFIAAAREDVPALCDALEDALKGLPEPKAFVLPPLENHEAHERALAKLQQMDVEEFRSTLRRPAIVSACDPRVRCTREDCRHDVPRYSCRAVTTGDRDPMVDAAIAKKICLGCEAAEHLCEKHGKSLRIGFASYDCETCEQEDEDAYNRERGIE